MGQVNETALREAFGPRLKVRHYSPSAQYQCSCAIVATCPLPVHCCVRLARQQARALVTIGYGHCLLTRAGYTIYRNTLTGCSIHSMAIDWHVAN